MEVSSCKPLVVIIDFPYTEKMIEIVKDNGFEIGHWLDWLGVALEEMLLLPFINSESKKDTANKLDNELKLFREHIYKLSLMCLWSLNPVSIIRFKLRTDGSVIIFLNKEQHVSEICFKSSPTC